MTYADSGATFRPTRAEIDLDAIRDNVRALGANLASGVERLAVVKANAYGHGDVPVARAALDAGATWLGVALVEEGVRLRAAGIDAPILLLVEPPPAAAKAVVAHALTASVWSPAVARSLDEAAQAAGTVTDVHVCVDTGMHREGVPEGELEAFVDDVAALDGLQVQGLWSHFAVADEEGDPFTATQAGRFTDAIERVRRAGHDIELTHMSNSAGAISVVQGQHSLVRLGIAMYGLYPAPWQRPSVALRPAMRLVSEVSVVRRVAAGEGISYGLIYGPAADATIANVPIGYGDGYTRLLSGRGEVLIGGKRRPIAGRVTMDTIMVDCGDDAIEVGDEVVLIGSQGAPGRPIEEITADEIAATLGTINYEVVCAVSARVPRVYLL